MDNKNNNIVNYLNKELEVRGWSMREFSRRSGLSHTAVSDVLKKGRVVGYRFCSAIANALNEPLESILREANLLQAERDEEGQAVLELFNSLSADKKALAKKLLKVLYEEIEVKK